MPLYKRHWVIESVLNGCLGLYNKPKADVHPGHKLTGPKEEEEDDVEALEVKPTYSQPLRQLIVTLF